MESNNSGYRGNSDRSWVRRAHRAYEYLEGKLRILGSLGDTWHMAFRKTAANSTDTCHSMLRQNELGGSAKASRGTEPVEPLSATKKT